MTFEYTRLTNYQRN